MDFNFTSEQDQLRDTVARLVRQQYDFDTRRKVAKSEAGWRPEMWSQFAELGLLGASFSEEDGGFGGGAIEAMIISEEFGKGLVIEPYLQTVIIGGNFLRHGGTAAQKEEHIAGLVGGETIFAFAYSEPKSRFILRRPLKKFQMSIPMHILIRFRRYLTPGFVFGMSFRERRL